MASDPPRVLIVDDDTGVCNLLDALLSRAGFDVSVAHTAESGLELIDRGGIDVVITDKNLPRMSGMDLIRACGQRKDGPETMLITAYGSLESAIEAMDLGARGYLLKPFEDLDEVVAKVKKLVDAAAERRKLAAMVEELRRANEHFAEAQAKGK